MGRNCDYAVKVYSSEYSITRTFVLRRGVVSRENYSSLPFFCDSKMMIFFSRDTRARSIIFFVPCVDDVISGTGFVKADTCRSRRIARGPSRSHVALWYERFVVNTVSQFAITLNIPIIFPCEDSTKIFP